MAPEPGHNAVSGLGERWLDAGVGFEDHAAAGAVAGRPPPQGFTGCRSDVRRGVATNPAPRPECGEWIRSMRPKRNGANGFRVTRRARSVSGSTSIRGV